MRARLLLVAIAALAATVMPAHAGPVATRSIIAAAPGAWVSNYATLAAAWTPGMTLTFVNADIQSHNVISDATRAPGTADWCPAGGPRCPLFYSPNAGLGGMADVRGLHDIAPGTYGFFCGPHPWMKGTLAVVDPS